MILGGRAFIHLALASLFIARLVEIAFNYAFRTTNRRMMPTNRSAGIVPAGRGAFNASVREAGA